MDPVRLEVVRHALQGIVEGMGVALYRSCRCFAILIYLMNS